MAFSDAVNAGGVALAPATGGLSLLAGPALSFLGGLFGDSSQANQQQQQLRQQQAMFEAQRQDQQKQLIAQFLAQTFMNDKNNAVTQGRTGLESTQMDPYAQAKALNGANVRNSVAHGMQPNGTFSGNLDMSALDPSHLSAISDYFYKNAANANPNVPLGGVSSEAEKFRQQNNANTQSGDQSERGRIMDYLSKVGDKPASQGMSLTPKMGYTNPKTGKLWDEDFANHDVRATPNGPQYMPMGKRVS